jgi:hypothetical protein
MLISRIKIATMAAALLAGLALPIHDDLRFRAFAAFGTSGRTGSFGFFTA